MAKGDGSITQRGRGTWRVRVSAGFDPATGRRQYASATVHGTKADARRERDRLRAEVEGGMKLDASASRCRSSYRYGPTRSAPRARYRKRTSKAR